MDPIDASSPQKHTLERGFTFVELLVVIAIVGIISTFGIARLIEDSLRKSYQQEVSKFVDTVELAQSRAQSGDSSGCANNEQVYSYSVMKTSASQYQVTRQCASNMLLTPTLAPTTVPNTYRLSSSAVFSSQSVETLATFRANSRVTPGVEFKLIDTSNNANCRCVRVNSSGQIQESASCTVAGACTY
jgi:prepilin-type N-terminal cleavage/methylation domain-containing protein